MSKQLEGLCPHGRHSTAVCLDCGLEADIYQPNRQIDWKNEDPPELEAYYVKPCPVKDPHQAEEGITAQSVLQEAIDAISDRAPYRDANGKKTFELASEIFGKITGHDLDEHDACMFLASIKLARSQQGEFHVDDFVDAAAYISLAGEARAGQVRPTGKRPKVREYLSQDSDDGRDRSESDVSE